MSWLARSIASLTATDGDDDDDESGGVARRRDAGERRSRAETDVSSPAAEEGGGRGEGSGEVNPGRGVKEDLSELTKTLTRQLWGVASFLAPLPTSSSSPQPPSPSRAPSSAGEDSHPSDPIVHPDPTISKGSEYSEVVPDSPRMAGIRSDFAEIGGRFRSGISKLSANKAVTEISKIASSFLQFGADGEEEMGVKDDEDEELEERYRSGGSSAIGVTEEVLAFARNISMHPETWLDFPLFPGDGVADDFDMSDAQQEHALAVEHLVPRLAALRIELCPSHMSEGCFWKIYFVLLHPRLNKQDSEFLSTPQIVEARAMLLQDLQNRTKSVTDRAGSGVTNWKDGPSVTVATSGAAYGSMPHKRSPSEEDDPTSDSETEKHPVISTEIKIVDKSVIEEEIPLRTKDIQSDASKISIEKYEDNGDEWLEEDNIEIGDSRTASIPIGNEEDVSFSDLEEDDEKAPTGSKAATNILNPQATGSRGWVHLGTDSGGSAKNSASVSPGKKESNEWSDLDDIDVM